jgi:hypothetical protein
MRGWRGWLVGGVLVGLACTQPRHTRGGKAGDGGASDAGAIAGETDTGVLQPDGPSGPADAAGGASGGAGTGGTATGGAGVAGTGGATGGTAGGAPGGAGGGGDFPLTPILDSFNMSDGPLVDGNWWNEADVGVPWRVAGNQAVSQGEKARRTEFRKEFDPRQEAFFTVTEVPAKGRVFLLFECAESCNCAYAAYGEGLLHFGYEDEGTPCGGHDVAITPMKLEAGSRLGVRTRGDKKVEVYLDGRLFQTYDLATWSRAGVKGWIGFRADLTGYLGLAVKLDDFGGGSLP